MRQTESPAFCTTRQGTPSCFCSSSICLFFLVWLVIMLHFWEVSRAPQSKVVWGSRKQKFRQGKCAMCLLLWSPFTIRTRSNCAVHVLIILFNATVQTSPSIHVCIYFHYSAAPVQARYFCYSAAAVTVHVALSVTCFHATGCFRIKRWTWGH